VSSTKTGPSYFHLRSQLTNLAAGQDKIEVLTIDGVGELKGLINGHTFGGLLRRMLLQLIMA
jgi:hypothetical protein